jgi:hypothetical protein
MAARLVRAADQESGSSSTNRFFRARKVRDAWARGLTARHNTDVMALLAERGN